MILIVLGDRKSVYCYNLLVTNRDIYRLSYGSLWSQTYKPKEHVMRMHGMAGLMVCILQDCIFTHGEKGVKGHNCRQHS